VLEPGTRIGRYEIVGVRARGGMATVYEAERSDGVYRQRVALKVLRRGLDTDDLIARFLAERQILSSLAHPNIARLLDGGSLADGRPYLVMELVEGEPITRYAERLNLDVAARLELMLGVADAVHAAHRRLVVPRDIKPSNILVDTESHVKLLDFGIAKGLAPDPGDSGTPATEAGTRALTPEYASPEQLQGKPISTATDVYQLGLLLRELLTGCRPGGAESTPHRRPLDRDLVTVIGKALRLEPDQRYASADEFASEIRRFLHGLPIHAHPESALYRARKFVGRHPMFVPLLSGAVVALGVFIAALTGQNRKLQRERDLAEASSQRAQQTQGFLVDLFRSPDPYAPADPTVGREITVVQALRVGAERARETLARQPEVGAALLSTIGGVFESLQQYDDAKSVLDEALTLRRELGDTTCGEYSGDLGSLARVLGSAGERDSADRLLTRRLALERGRAPTRPDLLSDALVSIGQFRSGADPVAAITPLEEAVRIARQSGRGDLSGALGSLAGAYREAGFLDKSETAAREALAMLENEEADDDPNIAMAAHSLGQTLGERGKYDEATALLERSVRVFDRRLGPDHPFTVSMRNNLAVLLLSAGKYALAEQTLRKVLEARRQQFGDEHVLIAGALQNLAVAVAGQAHYREAEDLTRRAEAMYRRVVPGSYLVALPMLTRAGIQLDGGDAAGAARSSAAAARLLRGKVPDTNPAAIMADCRLGRARAALGALDEARQLLASVAARMEHAEGVRDSHREECRSALATLPAGEGDDR
jgi:eukaryotic-like serine/threonine-protein kinase